MVGKKMQAAINKQIHNELYSAYLYLAMAAYADVEGLKGAANWFRVQFQEEMVHAMKFFNYLISQGTYVELQAIEQPPSRFKSLLDMYEATLKHERFITQCINDLMELAIAEKDHASQILLQWYVTEQVEEEANPTEIIGQLKLAGKDGSGLLMIDQKLAGRVFVPPADASGQPLVPTLAGGQP